MRVSKRGIAVLATVMLAATLVAAPSASAQGAGFNKASSALEAAFKAASNERIQSDDGCYPAAPELASAIGASVAASVKAVKKAGKVHVISGGTNCSRVLLAFRTKGSTWVLNSQTGNVVEK